MPLLGRWGGGPPNALNNRGRGWGGGFPNDYLHTHNDYLHTHKVVEISIESQVGSLCIPPPAGRKWSCFSLGPTSFVLAGGTFSLSVLGPLPARYRSALPQPTTFSHACSALLCCQSWPVPAFCTLSQPPLLHLRRCLHHW